MTEDVLVGRVLTALQAALPKSLVAVRGAPLLYQVLVDNELKVTIDPRRPVRGRSAFETDLCVFEQRRGGLRMPRVVLEFKTRLTTHDVLTYSAKARKHKGIYPYLRYGMVTAQQMAVPGRFFTHNEALDFCLALGRMRPTERVRTVRRLVLDEVRESRKLEKIAFESDRVYLYRTVVKLSHAR